MIVGVMVVMVMRVPMSMRMCLVVIMAVHLAVFVGMPLARIGFAMRTRIFIEDQGFDRDRHGPRRHANASQVDKVKAPQGDAINDQDFAFHPLVFFEEVAQIVRNVAIGHDVQMSLLFQSFRQPIQNALRQSIHANKRRCAQPTQ